ncbi:phage tail protein [Pleurocapsa sp. PCC 7319]|uniref:phage tail protein n=1 Tax=Pleurocapsa sp. PCC 7319 TaxID=118161 RepID=UPI00034DEEF4|nr:phage tail protein [Pleurocapsa sp. PCC 7319]
MKSPEFKFLVLNTKADWELGEPSNLTVDDKGIRIKSGLQFVPQHLLNRFPIVDFAVGDLTQVYLLDAQNRRIVLFDSRQNYYESIDLLQDLVQRPTYIAYSPATVYVADEFSPSNQTRIYAFAQRDNWQVRWIVTLPVGLKPVAMVADREGNLYVLLNIGEQLIVKYNAAGQQIPTTEFTRDNLSDPQAMAIASNGNLYVLTAEAIVKFKPDNDHAYTCAIIGLEELISRGIQPSGLTIDSNENLYIGDRRNRNIAEEEERFIFRLDPSEKTTQPIMGYRGVVTKLILDSTNHLVVFNSQRQEIRILQGEKQFLRTPLQKLPRGEFTSQVLDSTKLGQCWHKIVLDAEIPDNTQIKVYYASSDELTSDRSWSEPIINPQDALFREATGRYLYLKIELIGNDWHTPTIRSLRVYFPRLSYLRYLPAVYQEDETSRDFLERFLSIFETYFNNIETQIDQVGRYFDAEVVPSNFLPWLASWMAIAVDENWTDSQLRQLIQKAPYLYRQRGTREGIAATVEILTGSPPLIVESFQQTDREESNQNNPFRFWVLLAPADLDNKGLQSIQRQIEAEKPAHTEAVLKVLPPWTALNRQSYLGVNSRILDPALRLDRGAVISQDSILTDPEEYGQVGRRARLELDTVIN